MSEDAKDAGLVAMISSILGGGRRAEVAEAPGPAELIPAAPEQAATQSRKDAAHPEVVAAIPAGSAGERVAPDGKRRLPAEAIAELVLGELRKIAGFPASGASVTVYGYRHWNAMITFAPFSTSFQNATRFRQAMPEIVLKLRRFVELEV